MKKFTLCFISILFAAALLFAAAAAALNELYYKNVFPVGVWINGIYCTGMTAQDAAELLDSTLWGNFRSLTVRTLDGEEYVLNLEEYGVSASYQPAVEAVYAQNRGYAWLKNFAQGRVYQLTPEYTYDMEVMKAELTALDWLNERIYNPENTVSIVKSEDEGYLLSDETRDLLLRDKAVELICDAIVNDAAELDLSPCYQSVPYTDEMKDTLAKWEGVSAFQSFRMTYLFGDREELIDEAVVSDWMALDDEGNIVFDENNYPVLDETLIEEYVAYLSATYDTVGITREFQTTSGRTVTVEGGSYGNAIDTEAEYAFLLDAFLNGESGIMRIPAYKTAVWEKGADDIGSTYIEVDMSEQHMYYYREGELILDTDVVTGNMARGWDTPAKVCYVYYKQQNRVLRGANYATPVKYWMAVDGNIGIHDATWRKEFGGDIYLTNGSHGCINTPLEVMSELYELVEQGTPVILFY